MSQGNCRSATEGLDGMGKEITAYEKMVIQGIVQETLYATEVGINRSLTEALKKSSNIYEKEIIEVKFIKLGEWRNKQADWGQIKLVDLLFEFNLKINENIYPDKWRGWTDGEKIRFPLEMIVNSFKFSTINVEGGKIETPIDTEASLSQAMWNDIHNGMKGLGISRKEYEPLLYRKVENGEFNNTTKLDHILSTLLREFNKTTTNK